MFNCYEENIYRGCVSILTYALWFIGYRILPSFREKSKIFTYSKLKLWDKNLLEGIENFSLLFSALPWQNRASNNCIFLHFPWWRVKENCIIEKGESVLSSCVWVIRGSKALRQLGYKTIFLKKISTFLVYLPFFSYLCTDIYGL